LRVTDDGELEVLGNIDEGYYSFDIVAVDYGPNSTTVLKDRSKVINILYIVFISLNILYTFLTKDFTKKYFNLLTIMNCYVYFAGVHVYRQHSGL